MDESSVDKSIKVFCAGPIFYVCISGCVTALGISLKDADYAHFFDVPPTGEFEAYITEVASTMRERGVAPAVTDRLRGKWTSLREKLYVAPQHLFRLEVNEDFCGKKNCHPKSEEKRQSAFNINGVNLFVRGSFQHSVSWEP